MKFTCLKEHLVATLTKVERSVAKTTHLPSLTHLLLATGEGKLMLATTDLEIGIEAWCQGKVDAAGKLTVPARAFGTLVASLPEDKVVLEAKHDTCVVTARSLEAHLRGLPAEEFPAIPRLENQPPLLIKSQAFAASAAQVVESAAPEGGRLELGGVLFEVKPGELALVATDSFRLARRTVRDLATDGIDRAFFQDHTLIVPQRTVRELVRIINPDEGELTASIGETQIQFAQRSFRLVSRLIEGTYPRYEDIIPASALGRRTFNRRQLLSTLKRAEIFSGRLERVEVSFGDEAGTITSQDPNLGSFRERLASAGEGPTETFVFNIGYLGEGAAFFTGEEVHLEYNEPHEPVVLHEGERERALYVVMPMKRE